MTDQDKARRGGPNPNAVVYHDSSDTTETAINLQAFRLIRNREEQDLVHKPFVSHLKLRVCEGPCVVAHAVGCLSRPRSQGRFDPRRPDEIARRARRGV